MNVVILGGGFCGTFVAKYLESNKQIKTTLIDKKEFFEYSPGLHKVITKPSLLESFRIPFDPLLPHTTIVTDTIRSVTPETVKTKNDEISYDHLVVCTGIDYPIFLDNTENVHTLKHGKDALAIAEKINAAESILIIGGGLIGTEIAGELVLKTAEKNITVVHSKNRLLERNGKDASNFAQKFLEKNKAKLIFDQKIIEHKEDLFVTDNGKEITADLAIWCGGIKVNPFFMADFPKECFSEKNALNVNEKLQLVGYPHIFVGGDITSVKEEKTARKAKIHGKIIARNIKRAYRNKPLQTYSGKPPLQVISLGDTAGVIQYHSRVINGYLIPGFLKIGARMLTQVQMM